jgi:hypothetical protein
MTLYEIIVDSTYGSLMEGLAAARGRAYDDFGSHTDKWKFPASRVWKATLRNYISKRLSKISRV